MHNVYLAVECGRLAEENESETRSELLMHPFYALEKDHLHLACSVLDPHAHPLVVLVKVYPSDSCLDLDVGHVGAGIAYADEGTLVYIAERIESDQIPYRLDSKLLVQKFSPLRTHSRKKLNLHI